MGHDVLCGPPGWSLREALAGRLAWACPRCVKQGRAIEGHPARQTFLDWLPYFAYFDERRRCDDCGATYVFGAAEQQYWYETLRFWVQSRPKQCLPCRRFRRNRRAAHAATASAAASVSSPPGMVGTPRPLSPQAVRLPRPAGDGSVSGR